MLQRMGDLQTVAFKSLAYDPVPNRYGSKQELKEIEIQKEGGYLEQDFVQAVPGLNKLRNAGMNDSVQDGQQQGKEGPAREHENLCLLCFRLSFGNEITTRGNQAEDIFGFADHPGAGSRNDLPSRFPSGKPVSQCVAQFMEKHGHEAERPDKKNSNKIIHRTIPPRQRGIQEKSNPSCEIRISGTVAFSL